MSPRLPPSSAVVLVALLGAAACSSSMAKSPPRPEKPEHSKPSATPPKQAPVQSTALDPGDVELLRALRRRIDDLAAREQTVAERERAVSEVESRLHNEIDARLEEVKKLEERQGVPGSLATPYAERLHALAETLRPLSARKAAPIIAAADVDLAVTLLQELGTERAGAVLAQMEPTQAARLLDRTAGRGRTGRTERRP